MSSVTWRRRLGRFVSSVQVRSRRRSPVWIVGNAVRWWGRWRPFVVVVGLSLHRHGRRTPGFQLLLIRGW